MFVSTLEKPIQPNVNSSTVCGKKIYNDGRYRYHLWVQSA